MQYCILSPQSQKLAALLISFNLHHHSTEPNSSCGPPSCESVFSQQIISAIMKRLLKLDSGKTRQKLILTISLMEEIYVKASSSDLRIWILGWLAVIAHEIGSQYARAYFSLMVHDIEMLDVKGKLENEHLFELFGSLRLTQPLLEYHSLFKHVVEGLVKIMRIAIKHNNKQVGERMLLCLNEIDPHSQECSFCLNQAQLVSAYQEAKKQLSNKIPQMCYTPQKRQNSGAEDTGKQDKTYIRLLALYAFENPYQLKMFIPELLEKNMAVFQRIQNFEGIKFYDLKYQIKSMENTQIKTCQEISLPFFKTWLTNKQAQTEKQSIDCTKQQKEGQLKGEEQTLQKEFIQYSQVLSVCSKMQQLYFCLLGYNQMFAEEIKSVEKIVPLLYHLNIRSIADEVDRHSYKPEFVVIDLAESISNSDIAAMSGDQKYVLIILFNNKQAKTYQKYKKVKNVDSFKVIEATVKKIKQRAKTNHKYMPNFMFLTGKEKSLPSKQYFSKKLLLSPNRASKCKQNSKMRLVNFVTQWLKWQTEKPVRQKDSYLSAEEFEQRVRAINEQNFEQQMFRLYTQQNFVYRFLNQFSRTIVDCRQLVHLEYLFVQMFKAVKRKFQSYNSVDDFLGEPNKGEDVIKCYRGCWIEDAQFDELGKGVGNYISTPCFISSSLREEAALYFQLNAMLIINIDRRLFEQQKGHLSGFANIKTFSTYLQEEEVLFNPNNKYKILNTWKKGNIKVLQVQFCNIYDPAEQDKLTPAQIKKQPRQMSIGILKQEHDHKQQHKQKIDMGALKQILDFTQFIDQMAIENQGDCFRMGGESNTSCLFYFKELLYKCKHLGTYGQRELQQLRDRIYTNANIQRIMADLVTKVLKVDESTNSSFMQFQVFLKEERQCDQYKTNLKYKKRQLKFGSSAAQQIEYRLLLLIEEEKRNYTKILKKTGDKMIETKIRMPTQYLLEINFEILKNHALKKCKDQLQREEISREIAETKIRLSKSYYDGDLTSSKKRIESDDCQKYLQSQAKGESELHGEFYLLKGEIYRNITQESPQQHNVERYLLKALQIFQNNKKCQLKVAETKFSLGKYYYHHSDYLLSEAMFKEGLELYSRLLGVNEPKYLSSHGALTRLHFYFGQHEQYAREYGQLERAVNKIMDNMQSISKDECDTFLYWMRISFDNGQYDKVYRKSPPFINQAKSKYQTQYKRYQEYYIFYNASKYYLGHTSEIDEESRKIIGDIKKSKNIHVMISIAMAFGEILYHEKKYEESAQLYHDLLSAFTKKNYDVYKFYPIAQAFLGANVLRYCIEQKKGMVINGEKMDVQFGRRSIRNAEEIAKQIFDSASIYYYIKTMVPILECDILLGEGKQKCYDELSKLYEEFVDKNLTFPEFSDICFLQAQLMLAEEKPDYGRVWEFAHVCLQKRKRIYCHKNVKVRMAEELVQQVEMRIANKNRENEKEHIKLILRNI